MKKKNNKGGAWCVCVCVNSDYVYTLKKKSGQNPGIGKFVGDFEGGCPGPPLKKEKKKKNK